MSRTIPSAAKQPSVDVARPRPAFLRALGKQEPPQEVSIVGEQFQRVKIYKHDSWAATALYQSEMGREVVCKFNRKSSLLIFPMSWLGQWLAAREAWFLQKSKTITRIPESPGPVVVDGQLWKNAVSRNYVSGHPLLLEDRPDEQFFQELEDVFTSLHQLGIAYVDSHKRENVIYGDDGHPYLIDFQISVSLPRWWPFSWLLKILQQSDFYHLQKHRVTFQEKYNREQGIQETILIQRPWWIKWHRSIAVPFRSCRRRLLVKLGVRKGEGRSFTEFAPEDAVQRTLKAG